MTRIGSYTEGFPDDKCCAPGRAALEAMGERDFRCCKCPFPFCVILEARKLRNLARSYAAASMMSLGGTVANTAARLGVSASWVRRSFKSSTRCYWCSVDRIQANIFCKSDLCTVAPQDGEVVVAFSSHRLATDAEERKISDMVEWMFPHGVLARPRGSTGSHDHWVVSNLPPGEAVRVYTRMSELSKYAPILKGVH